MHLPRILPIIFLALAWYDDFGSTAFSFDSVTMTVINETTNTIVKATL